MRWRWPTRDSAALNLLHRLGWLVVILHLLLLLPQTLRADYLRLRGNFDYVNAETEITSKATGATDKTDSQRFEQDYILDFSKDLYPYLSFGGGVFYQKTDLESASDIFEGEFDETFLRPYARLDLRNPMYRAGLTYRRSEAESQISGLPRDRRLRDEYDALFGWQPVDLPDLLLRYNQTRTYDDPKRFDRIESLFNLESRYEPVRNLQLYYNYQYDSTEERLQGSETVDQRHTGRVDYGRRFIDDRLSLTTSYRIDYGKQELPATTSVDNPLIPSAGLSAIDDTPDEGQLNINNALIDGNLTASAGLDIGLGGDETTLTNIGLDLGLPTAVDRILVWVDRRLSTIVAGSFSWDIYTSPDNNALSDWTLIATVAPATFDTFENRFEIRFASVTTRFIKVVTRPLSPLLPGAINFPNIFVTEIEAFVTVSGVPTTDTLDRLSQDISLNLSGRLGPQTVAGYDFYYRDRKQEFVFGTQKANELSNGLFLNHTFNRQFSASARVLRTDTSVQDVDTVDYSYSAALRANYLKNFNQSLVYSGTRSEEPEGTSMTNSLFLRNNAVLYQGWSAYLDAGYSIIDRLSEPRENATTIRFGTNVEPSAKITANFDMTVSFFERPDLADGDYTETLWNLQIFYLPVRTLSLFGKLSVRNRETSNTTLQNYAVNWSPLRDGTLQFSLSYSETLRDPEDRRDRSFGPFLKWIVSRHIIVTTAYTFNYSDTVTQEVESTSFVAELNLIF